MCACVSVCVCVCVFTDVMDSNPDVKKKRSGDSEGGVSTCDSEGGVSTRDSERGVSTYASKWGVSKYDSEGGVSTCDSDRSVNNLVWKAVCAKNNQLTPVTHYLISCLTRLRIAV